MSKRAYTVMLTVLVAAVLTAVPAFCQPGRPDGPGGPDRMGPDRGGPERVGAEHRGKMEPPAPTPPPPAPQAASSVTIQIQVTPIPGTTTVIEIRTLDTHDGPRPGLDRRDRPAPPAPADRRPDPESRRDGDRRPDRHGPEH